MRNVIIMLIAKNKKNRNGIQYGHNEGKRY